MATISSRSAEVHYRLELRPRTSFSGVARNKKCKSHLGPIEATNAGKKEAMVSLQGLRMTEMQDASPMLPQRAPPTRYST